MTTQVEFLKSYSIYRPGMIHHVPDDVAKSLIAVGAAKPFVPPQPFSKEHITSRLVRKAPAKS